MVDRISDLSVVIAVAVSRTKAPRVVHDRAHELFSATSTGQEHLCTVMLALENVLEPVLWSGSSVRMENACGSHSTTCVQLPEMPPTPRPLGATAREEPGRRSTNTRLIRGRGVSTANRSRS